MILLLSNKWDISLDFVVRELRQRKASFMRINTEDLPDIPVTVSFPDFSFRLLTLNTSSNLTNLKSVLLRRPGKPFPEQDPTHFPAVNYAREQWHALIEGLQAIDGVFWINNPRLSDRMESKIVQLREAIKLGFAVPRTCITSSKEMAEDFIASCEGRVMAKSLASSLIQGENHDYFVFTTLVQSLESATEEELKSAPSIFQEYLNPKRDLRVTVIGDRVYTVQIIGSNGDPIVGDWRILKKGINFTPFRLPAKVEELCATLIARNGLTFGAIDLAEVNGEYYFLEINPSGEWGWLQAQVKVPVAEALADYLMAGTNERAKDDLLADR